MGGEKRINYKYEEKVGDCYFLHDTKSINYNRYAMFRCECGKEFEAAIQHVKRGKIKSCGCFVIKYTEGQKLGKCHYIREVDPYTTPSGLRNRKALFKCRCGNEFEAIINSVKREDIVSCGCYNRKIVGDTHRKHGLCEDSNYKRWLSMKNRCFNPNDVAYKHYGGRGITVCEEWKHNAESYVNYITSLPNSGDPKLQTIDRINNEGNYEPGNLRWADWYMQANNKRNNK